MTRARIDAILQLCERICLALGGITLIWLTFMTVIDVMMRYIFFAPIPGASESTELLLPWIVFLAMAYTLRVGGHVRVTLVTTRLPKFMQRWCEELDCIVGLVFFGVLTYCGWFTFLESFKMNEFMLATVKLPWWAGKFALPFGLFFMELRYLFRFISLLTTGTTGSEQEPERLADV